MNKLQANRIIKEIVQEIYQEPRIPSATEKRPVFDNVEYGRLTAQSLLNSMGLSSQILIKAAIEKNNQKYSEESKKFNSYRIGLVSLTVEWARKIYETHPSLMDTINKIMEDVRNHVNQITLQGMTVLNSIADPKLKRPNYINAMNEFKHFKEIISNTGETIDELFNLAKGLKI